MSFQDVFGNVFTEIRTRWYLSPEGQNYRTYALHSDVIIPCVEPLNESVIKEATPVSQGRQAAVFFESLLSCHQTARSAL